MKFQITSRWSSAVKFECELTAELENQPYGAKLGFAIKKALSEPDANLRDANLRGANLGDADLRGADLGGADLRGANLGGADLGGADLGGADLRGANLGGADLGDANLGDADLGGADLTTIRDDLWAVLSSAPAEAEGLRQAIADGRINGSTYTGECACLVGTIANVRGIAHDCLGTLRPNSRRPAEMFFLGIKTGDKPETSQFSALALQWTDQWLAAMRATFGQQS